MKLNLQKNGYDGKLIVFEGCDGSGKTTILNEVKKILEEKNIEYYATKMPSQRIRNIDVFNDYDNSQDNFIRENVNLENLTIMVSGDRLLVQDLEIVPALKQGKVVLCDRYCYTSLARCNTKIIEEIANKFIEPNLVIYAKSPPKVLKMRVKSRKNEKNNYYNDKDVQNQIKIFDELSHDNDFVEINTNKQLDIKKLTSIISKVI